MQLEIIGTDGTVHYTRPHDHPDVWEALNTPGYSVRGTGEKQASGSLHPAGSAALLEIIKTCEDYQNMDNEGMELEKESDEGYRTICKVIGIASGLLAEAEARQNEKLSHAG